MSLDILTFGEALVEIMRSQLDVPFDVPGEFLGPYPSGAPFIFAVQAARLGVQASACGCVGASLDGSVDGFGRCLIDQLARDGVNTDGVIALPGYTTGAAFVAYQTGGARDFIFHLRHAAAGQLSPRLLDLPRVRALFDGLKCLHLTGSSLSIHEDALALGRAMLTLAQEAGAKISFDPNLRPQLIALEAARAAFTPFIEAADVILPTGDELLLLTGEQSIERAAASLITAKPGRVVAVKQGEDGCTVFTASGGEHVPGYAVTEVDPTGAGDCFDAGFLVRWLAGASAGDAAQWGNACGALAVTERGPMAGAAHLSRVETLINSMTNRALG